jgi:hypothetical protein
VRYDPKAGDDPFIRRVLWTTAFFNLGGAALFGFPSSPLGRLAGLPAFVPGVYRALLALFVLLFAGAYAWLARSETIDRPLVAFAAIGKASAFAVICGFWLLGAAPARAALLASGDLVFAVLFAGWLIGWPTGSPASSAAKTVLPD